MNHYLKYYILYVQEPTAIPYNILYTFKQSVCVPQHCTLWPVGTNLCLRYGVMYIEYTFDS